MQLQSAIRETGKAYGLPGERSTGWPCLHDGNGTPTRRRRDRRTMEDVLATIESPVERQVVRSAYGLVGQPDHLSLHPGGVVITPGPLTDYAPIQMSPKGFLLHNTSTATSSSWGCPRLTCWGFGR